MSKPGTPSDTGDAPKVTSPNANNNATSSSRVFVRHEFHRSHRATHGNGDVLVRAKGETAAADAKKERLLRELAEEDRLAQQKKANAIAAKKAEATQKDIANGSERVPLMSETDTVSSIAKMSTVEADAERLSYGGGDGPLVMDRASVCHNEPKPKQASRQSLAGSVRSFKDAVTRYGGAAGSRISVGAGKIGSRLSQRFSGYGTEEMRIQRKKSLGVLTLCGLMFANSIGGGFGLEDSVNAGGGLLTIIFVIVLPLVWSLPLALVVAELATSISTNGGFLMWINVAFPAPVFFFTVFVTLMLTFVDNALYPNLFAEYLCQSLECNDWQVKLIKVAMLLVCSFLNLIGVEAVGFASVAIMLVSVLPFVMMFFWHLIAADAYFNWGAIAAMPSNIDWVSLIPVVSWNVAGLEQAGAVAEDIDNPQDTMVKSLIPLAIMTWASYIPPILAGLSITRGAVDLGIWETGYWATVAGAIGGSFLKILTVIGGVASAFGMCMSGLCTTSRTMAGMGEAAAFPRPISKVLFTYNTRFGTPHWSIIINTILTGTFAVFFDFSYLVVIDQVLYGLRLVMIFMACIKLRYLYPTLERPYRIPVGSDTLCLLLLLPLTYCIALIVISASVDVTTAGIIVGVSIGVLVFSYLYCRFFRPNGFDGKIIRIEEVVHSESCTEDDEPDDIRSNSKDLNKDGTASSSTTPIGCTSNISEKRHTKTPSDLRKSRRHYVTKSVVIDDVEGVAYGDNASRSRTQFTSSEGIRDPGDDDDFAHDDNGAEGAYTPPRNGTRQAQSVDASVPHDDNITSALPNKEEDFSDVES